MTVDWISSPIVLGAISGAGLLALLALWIAARIEIAALRKEIAEVHAATNGRLDEFLAGLSQLRTDVESASVPTAPVATRSLNLNRRSQIIRMARRGEETASIAATLSAPRNEVELLLKPGKLATIPKPAEVHSED